MSDEKSYKEDIAPKITMGRWCKKKVEIREKVYGEIIEGYFFGYGYRFLVLKHDNGLFDLIPWDSVLWIKEKMGSMQTGKY